MSDLTPLSPLGTVRMRWLERAGPSATSLPSEALPSEILPAELVARVAADELSETDLYLAWEMVRAAVAASPVPIDLQVRRRWIAVGTALLVAQRSGSICLPAGGQALVDALVQLGLSDLAPMLGDAAADLSDQPGFVGPSDRGLPCVLDGDRLYLRRAWQLEQQVVRQVLARVSRPGHSPERLAAVRAAIEDVVGRPPRQGSRVMQLTAGQQAALQHALLGSLCAVTGGPGTGKTSIVVSLLRAWCRLGGTPDAIALAAPTGKAAQRLETSIRATLEAIDTPDAVDQQLRAALPRAVTLHRLLGFSPTRGKFRHGPSHRLSQRLVIVDEASMIPLALGTTLLSAARDDAQLILLGDADQLPSVEAGSVFRDLVPDRNAEADPRHAWSARLEESFRMDPRDPAGRHILGVAQAVHEGRIERWWRGDARAGHAAVQRRPSPEGLGFAGVEYIEQGETAPQRQAFLDVWLERRLTRMKQVDLLHQRVLPLDGMAFAPHDATWVAGLLQESEASTILCVTRGDSHPTGALALNAQLHARVLSQAHARGMRLWKDPYYLAGESVIVRQNDYVRGLYNGDRGIVMRVANLREGGREARGPHLAVIFQRDGELRAHPLHGILPLIELAYATTVHKAQGSEFDHVAIVMPEDIAPWNAALCTREVLYTAMTRSRRSVVLLGSQTVLAHAVAHRSARYSGLAHQLCSALQPPQ